MANNYKKNFLAFTILLATTALFINGCSKSKNPEPNNQTQITPTDNAPTISSLSVTTGVNNAVVIIYGTNFSTTLSANRVFFNGKAATVTAATATQLTVTVPADAGTGPVTISVNNGATITGPVFTYTDPLKITSIDVDKGAPGTTVKITGTGFSTTLTDNKVFFNGKAATVTAATTTLLTVTVPAGAGTGSITVSLTGGTTVTGPTFTYIEVLSITSTDVDKGIAGATVNINGTGFSTTITDNKVFFNGMAATVTAATAIKLTVKVPTGAGIGKVTITLNGQSATGPIFNYYLSSTVTTFAGNGVTGITNGPGLSSNFSFIYGMAIDDSDNIFVCDYPGKIRKITPAAITSTFAGEGPEFTYNNPNRFVYYPQNIALDNNNNVFFTEGGLSTNTGGKSLREVTAAGVVSTYVTPGATPVPAFGVLSAVASDKTGNLLITDPANGLVRKITSNGVITVAGNGRGAITDGTGTSAIFNNISMIAVDLNQNIYVVDYNPTDYSQSSPIIRKINSSNQVSTFYLATGTVTGMITDKSGNLYVSLLSVGQISLLPGQSGQLLVINPAGVASILVGTGRDPEGHVDGDQYSARFSSRLGGIVVDSAGNVFVGDNLYVRKITINK